MCEEPLFFPSQAFPANIGALVCRRDERVVMVHLAVTLGAADRRFVGDLRVDGVDHNGKS